MMEGTAEQRGEKLNLGLSVKERMALFQKQSHSNQPQAKPAPLDAGASVRDRARTLGVPAAPVPVRKEPTTSSYPNPVEKAAEEPVEEPAPRVSIKDRINKIESAAKATSARAPIDFPRPIVDRNPFPVSHLPPPPKPHEPSFPIEQPKQDPVRGRVAEMASKLSQFQGKPPSKPLDIGVSIQEKKQLLQQSSKPEPEKAKSDLEGLPSLEARKSLLSSLKPAAETRKDPVVVPGASLQDRLNALNKPSAEEGKRQAVEPMAESLAERKARIQQAMAAKMGAAGQGGPVAIPIITAGMPAFTPSTASSTSAVAPTEVEKPTIHHTLLRKVADFDDFD